MQHSSLTGFVCAVLANHGEYACPDRVGFYGSIVELVKTASSSKIWAMGEIFAHIPNPRDPHSKFILLKQIAESSCEMAIYTHHGFHDVVTAHLIEIDELEKIFDALLKA